MKTSFILIVLMTASSFSYSVFAESQNPKLAPTTNVESTESSSFFKPKTLNDIKQMATLSTQEMKELASNSND